MKSLLVALAVLVVARRATAAVLEGETEREQSIAVTGGEVALTLAANAELQTRWGPVVSLGAGGRLGPAVSAYVGDTIHLRSRWSLRPGFRFVRTWRAPIDCRADCRFDIYLAEVGFRYRGPSGFVFEYGLPLFAWLPVSTARDTQSHLSFYTLATGDLLLVGTVLVGFTFDL